MSAVILKPDIKYELGKIVCVGRNYVKHITEMVSERTNKPVLFLKPATAILNEGSQIALPDYSKTVHHEIELALLISKHLQSY